MQEVFYFRREEAAERPKPEFQPKTLHDLVLDHDSGESWLNALYLFCLLSLILLLSILK